MFPIIAIGSVIGAVISIAKGAGWVADKISTMQNVAPTGGQTDAKPKADAQTSPFEQALAAQAAGQTLPSMANTAPGTAPAVIVQASHGTNYDALARIQAGIAAYGRVGEHRDGYTPPVTAEDSLPPVAANGAAVGLAS